MNELIESHLGYAHAMAAELAGRFPPNILRADLERAAEFGLVQAAHSYDPSRGASFATFAYYRIRGAIFDEIRKSWNASHVKCEPDSSVSEVFADGAAFHKTSTSWKENEDIFSASEGAAYFISLDSTYTEPVSDMTESPATRVIRKEESAAIQEAIRQLPDRHRIVLCAHYFEDLSLVSISKQLNLSKSWVSRIHAQALAMVRKILQEPRSSSHRYLPSPCRGERAISLQATLCSE